MAEFKKGELVEVINPDYSIKIEKGCRLTVIGQVSKNTVELNCTMWAEVEDLKKIEIKSGYETSNRKKLHDHIKNSGYTSSTLGLEMGNAWHFSNITKKSRFDSFGDISNEQMEQSQLVVDTIVSKLKDISKKVDEQWRMLSPVFSPNGCELGMRHHEAGAQPIQVAAPMIFDSYTAVPYMGIGVIGKDGDNIEFIEFKKNKFNYIKLNRIAFAICVSLVILVLIALCLIVSK